MINPMKKKTMFFIISLLVLTSFIFAQDLPTSNAGDDVTVSYGCTKQIVLNGQYSTGDNISYQWLALNSSSDLNNSNLDTLIYDIPQTDFDYDYTFSLTVTDSDGDMDTDTVVVYVLADQVPVANAGASFSACDLISNADDFRVYLNGGASYDAEDSTALDYVWTVIDSGIEISASQSTKVTPYFNHPTNLVVDTEYRIELMVLDAGGWCSAYDTVTVTCLADMCPIADAGGDAELSSGCNTTFTLDATASVDPQGSALTFNWVSLNAYGANIEDALSETTTFTFPIFTTNKDLSFELTVSDGINTDIDTVEIEYMNDTSPIANAGDDASTNLSTWTLDGSGSSDDNPVNLDYDWTSLDGPSIASSNQSIATVAFNASYTSGSYRFELEVDDGYCTHADTVSIKVLDNMNPLAEAGDPFSVSGGCQTSFTLDGSASSDPEGTTLIYLWSVADSLSSYLSNETSVDGVTFTIPSGVIGKRVWAFLTVTDGDSLTHTDSVGVSVLDDIPPVADAGVDFESCTYRVSGSNYRVYMDGSGSSDVDGTVKFKWIQLDGIDVSMSSSQSKKETPYFNYPSGLTENEEVTFQLRAYDSDEYCEDFDTVVVSLLANKCPTADAGEDFLIPSGCNSSFDLVSEDSFDPEGSPITYAWTSLDGYTSQISNSDSDTATFTIPDITEDMILSFLLTVSDGNSSVSDSIFIEYIMNDAPVAVAGEDFSTCEYQFTLNGSRSYDINKNELSYKWTSPDGLTIGSSTTARPVITSPSDLEADSTYRISLEVNDGYCDNYDTLLVEISHNLCPIAEAGETVRIPKFNTVPVLLNAATGSSDPDGVSGNNLSYEWTTPSGSIVTDSVVTVEDLAPNIRYSSYVYYLQVMDADNAISSDSVEVIFSEFSSPESPAIYAVADHGRVLVSWEATSESSIDSLTGYSDFEGYKLYRSTDDGETWGGDNDKLYDYNGNFVGWKPYAQFDLDMDEDMEHCIYADDDCESELFRGVSISGLDPLAPRFSLGINSGIEYSFVDSNVTDGVRYSYTVTSYDIGFDPFDLEMDNMGIETDTVLVDTINNIPYSFMVTDTVHAGGWIYYSIVSTNDIISVDTVWTTTNPDQFLGPDSIVYNNESGNFIRKSINPTRGYYSLESNRGDSTDNNFITVTPGYTALDISFPNASNIEALFKTNSNNIGNGIREYFIVDRTKIVQDQIIYEIQATQGLNAIDGMACEDPYIYGYAVNDSLGTPKNTISYLQDDLGFLEEDSISGLPGTFLENGTYLVPEYDNITKVGRWSNQFKGIRFKIENILKLNPSSAPDVEMDTLIWSWADSTANPMDTLYSYAISNSIIPELSYSNIASYKLRVNANYKVEFFDTPIGDSIYYNDDNFGNPIYMYTPFRITNMVTGKKVGLNCNDFGINDNQSESDDGNGDLVWTRGEDVLLQKDSVKIAGVWERKYIFNFDLLYNQINDFSGMDTSITIRTYDVSKTYTTGDIVQYKQMTWTASLPVDAGISPQAKYYDKADDGSLNNPWRLLYPWQGGEVLILSPQKFFVDGDSWYSDMGELGREVGIADTINLQTIKVVPNPYKASSRFNETQNQRKIRFTHLPKKCRISIYTVTGEHVTTFDHEEEFDGNAWWNLRTGNKQDGPEVAPGLYIYVIEFPEEKNYTIDTYGGEDGMSKKNDYYSDPDDDKKYMEKTKFHMGKFAIIR